MGYCLPVLQSGTCKSDVPIQMKSTIKFAFVMVQLINVEPSPGICVLCIHEIDALKLLLSFTGPLFCEILYWLVLIHLYPSVYSSPICFFISALYFLGIFPTYLLQFSFCTQPPHHSYYCFPVGQYTGTQRLVFLR